MPIRHPLRAAAAALWLGMAAGSAVAQTTPTPTFSPTQREEIGRIVRDYLLANPEVLGEAIALLEKKQAEAQKVSQEKALRESRETLLRAGYDTVAGNPSGDVTLVEFFDYNCPYCKSALADIQALVKGDNKLRVVLKDLPVLGPDSLEAHRVAIAAKQQLNAEKAFDYHSRLLSTRGRINGERATALAKEMGLDMARLARDLDGSVVRTAVKETRDLSEQLGITGTPAYVIGEEIISGAVGQGPLRQAIGSVRRCGRAVC